MPLSACGRLLLRPDVPVAVLRIGIAARLLEPRMLIRGVVDDEIDQHADAALLGAVGELDEVAERAVARIDAVVVGDVVAVVALGGGLERHQPDGGDAEAVQIIEAAHQPLEIADAVAVGVHVGADRQAIDDRVLVPEVVDHPAARRIEPTNRLKRTASVLAPLPCCLSMMNRLSRA